MYAPEKARATFLRSRAYRRLKETDKAEADAASAARQYMDITGAARVGQGSRSSSEDGDVALEQGDFDSLIAFWSR